MPGPESRNRTSGYGPLIRYILIQVPGILVLGAGTEGNSPGPLVTQMSRNSGSLPIPITIVPGEMSRDRLEAISKG